LGCVQVAPMEELAVLRHIFGNSVECSRVGEKTVYKITYGDDCIEFECDESYPECVPRMSVKKNPVLVESVRRKAKAFLPAPMVYDMIRLYLCENVERIDSRAVTITYTVDESDKITKEEFLEWKKRNRRVHSSQGGVTGKEHFLCRKRDVEESKSDEELEEQGEATA
jgi:hypothetical protein